MSSRDVDRNDEDAAETQHPLYEALKVAKENNSSDDYWKAVESLEKMLLNVKSYPLEEKYRKIPIDEPWYTGKVGSLEGHEKLMAAAGFHTERLSDGMNYYLMEASQEAWDDLLQVGKILYKVLKRSKSSRRLSRSSSRKSERRSSNSQANSSENVDPPSDTLERRSSSRRKSSSHHSRSRSSSRHKSSKRSSSRRDVNQSSSGSQNDLERSMGDSSKFEDEHEAEEFAHDGHNSSSSQKKKSSKKKKKKRSSSSHRREGENRESSGKSKKKKSSRKENGGSSDEEDEDSGAKAGSSMGESGESLTLDEALLTSPKQRKAKDLSSSPTESPIKGVTKAKYQWALAAAAVIEANRLEAAVDATATAADGQQHEAGASGEDVPLVSPLVSAMAKKDFWKSAGTQALLLARMREAAGEEELLEIDDEDQKEGNGEEPKSGKRLWLSAITKLGALETVSDATGGAEKSRRGLFGRGLSSRSASSDEEEDDDENPKTRRRRRRHLDPEESKRRLEELEKGLSRHEIEEQRKLIKEQEEMRAEKRKMLVEKIAREPGPRWKTTVILVAALTLIGLSIDLVTTIISCISLATTLSCCGTKIDTGSLTAGITIPYIVLLFVEFTLELCNIRQARKNSAWDKERLELFDDGGVLDDVEFFDENDSQEDYDEEKARFHFREIIEWILLANPFLGCLLTWVLLYEVNDAGQAILILVLNSSSMFFKYCTVIVERAKCSVTTCVLNVVPLFPFAATIFIVNFYMQKGGICWRDGSFWFDGCEMCKIGGTSVPAPKDALACPDGTPTYQDDHCGDIQSKTFCYFNY